MRTALRGLTVVSVLLGLGWWAWQARHAPPDPVEMANGARLTWGDCWFAQSFWRPVHCGRFTTAADPEAQPPQYALPVIYLPRPGLGGRDRPPLLYIAGGPGGANWLDGEGIAFWKRWQDENPWAGDLVLYDQRGVGLSQPAHACPEVRAAGKALLPLDLPTEEAYRRLRDATVACHRRLLAEPVSLDRLTTSHNSADAIDLMRASGWPRWDLFGVSYGTRVALDVLRRAPDLVRAAVLDSVYPPDVHAELNDAWLLQRSLELFTRICELADDCSRSPDALRADLDAALARVGREGLRLSVRDPDGGGDLAVFYGRDDLAWLLFEAMYLWDAIPALPDSVAALLDGRLDANMRRLIGTSVAFLLDDSISDAVAASVDCHDAGPLDVRDAAEMLRLYPMVADIKRLDWQYHACRYWASGDAGSGFRSPVVSDVPTLLLAGEFDPVTPPEWAEQAAGTLSRGHVFVFPAIGHGVVDSHACAAHLVDSFLAAPDAPSVPACLGGL
jgi:pimeloyl-ACP methyl ester carboxylesterase